MPQSLVKLLGKRWSSIIEIMAMMTILGIAVTAMFSTVIGGIYFAKDSENRIKAINLAREWIEWVTNLRNTNWLRFSSDQTNCWRVLDYNATCIGSVVTPVISNTSYVLEHQNGAWYLTGSTTGSWLWIDDEWYYYASGVTSNDIRCTFDIVVNCRSPFTREIRVTVIDAWRIQVTATVDWFERRAQNVTINTTLTNWKSKF